MNSAHSFLLQGFDDASYRPINKDWAEAQAFCKDKAEGTLATANDEETRNFLANYADYDVRRCSISYFNIIEKVDNK